ncbi:uncharacterized protein A4U43_C05F25150 [Asparagus officinalis]|uniref:CBS domain-containing protein n=1 Tax=Asparagus officinalis TaxID=4686 RepID=A0A5P1EUG8_ASPOF|nr:uncharacterized protein A4U43_C05F25150 [Asparagus officinalis]
MKNLEFRSRSPPLRETLPPSFLFIATHFRPKSYVSFSRFPRRLPKIPKKSNTNSPQNLNLRRLTSRIVDLTRRKQLKQVFEEVETAKRKYGKVNRIVMNAVMQACIRCKDLDSAWRVFDEMSKLESCGVDSVTYGILLKGLGEARKIDEAFQILESVEQGVAAGNPKLSPKLIYGLLNALLEAGDMRRANGLVARYRLVLHEDTHSVLLYNLLMKGYTNTDFPLGALTVRDEIMRQGLKPDKLTYNTLIFACVKSGKTDAAIQFLAEMKEEALKTNCSVLPDAVTYTTLLKGLGNEKDLFTIQKIVVEMKSQPDLFIDRTAYTAMADAFLACGSIRGALCIFGEMIKQAGRNKNLMPKPHLYLSMMRVFAAMGDFDLARKLHVHMWSGSVGSISPSARLEADELLMEAALNGDQIDVARQILSNTIAKQDDFTWTTRGGMLDAPLSSLMRGPPPCVTTSTSIGRVIDLILDKKYQMVVVVKNSNVYETSYSSSARPVGVFTREKILELTVAS